MRKIGVFVDVSNLYYSIKKRFNNSKLSYIKYLEKVAKGNEIIVTNAYGIQLKNEANKFINYLKSLGFNTKYIQPQIMNGVIKKVNWNVGITIDIIKNFENMDTIILGSGDRNFAPLIKYLRDSGKTVIVFACGISSRLKAASQCIEIDEGLLETSKTAK